MIKEITLRSKKRKIQGMLADKWLAKNEEICIFPREDGVLVRNICSSNLLVGGRDGKEKYVPVAGTVILQPGGENTFIRICGYMFAI